MSWLLLLIPAYPVVITLAALGWRLYERDYKHKGLSNGYRKLAVKNPHFVGLIGASGGQVRSFAVQR